MSVTQTISSTRVSGQHTFPLQATAQVWTNALVTIDRTVNGGLNSLAAGSTLDISIDYSPDGGTTWLNTAGVTLLGGAIVVKGVTLTEDDLAVGVPVPFPAGTGFQVNANASKAVRVAGTVVYS